MTSKSKTKKPTAKGPAAKPKPGPKPKPPSAFGVDPNRAVLPIDGFKAGKRATPKGA